MNAERLLEVYEQISEAPDAIARLRRFVLDLAVRGTLVEQDAGDEPASQLLDQIAQERKRLHELGEIKKPKKLPAIDVTPFDLPSSWTWVRMREVTSDRGQVIPSAKFTYIDVTAINKEAGVVSDPKVLTPEEAPSRARKVARKGDVIYSCVRPYLLNVAVITEEFDPAPIASTAFAILNGHDLVLPWYLWIALRSPFMVECVERDQRGQAYPAINEKDFSVLPLPLPPLAEQHRIVAKVNELMALCDRLEEARKTREETRDKLTAASLSRLTAPYTTRAEAEPEKVGTGFPSGSATTEDDFPAHANFALEALPALTTRPDQIKTLRQTILNLAIRGKLAKQDPADEPASELLEAIEMKRRELIKAGEIRKQKPMLSLESKELPFDAPRAWTWCRLGSLVLSSDAGWSPRTENHARQGDAWGVLKVSAVSWDHFDPEANKQVLKGTEPRLQAQVRINDFLISRANTAELVARAALVIDQPHNLMMSDKIVRLRLSENCDHRFVWLVNNNADYARKYYASNATGVSPSMKNVSRAVILNLPIPLPPLAEQHRIVAKVDALMTLCDRLEAALTTTDTTRTRLLEALLHEALEPSKSEDEIAA